jgi:L-alanine-DL-glutamate epimerase-like enolase superfamily enzyme
MRITGVTGKLLEYPLEEPFYPAWLPGYPQAFHRVNLVILETDESIKGYSAGFAFGQEGLKLGELLAPFLLGRDPFNVEEVIKILRSATFLGLRLWYIEPALWDIIGKALNVPIYKLLGSYQDRIKAYASTGELKGTEERLEYIEQIQKLGFRAVKLRFHSLDWRDDLKVARGARALPQDRTDGRCEHGLARGGIRRSSALGLNNSSARLGRTQRAWGALARGAIR